MLQLARNFHAKKAQVELDRMKAEVEALRGQMKTAQ